MKMKSLFLSSAGPVEVRARRAGGWLAAALALVIGLSVPSLAHAVGAWKRWETSFTAAGSYGNPYRDVELQITFTHTSGTTFKTFAFWNGGSSFVARAAFPKTGTWNWSTNCLTCAGDVGLHNKTGSVSVTSSGTDPIDLYRFGFPKVETFGNHTLVYDVGQRFTWLGDTAWTAPMRATASEWAVYLADRQAKGFTVIQIAGSACWMANPLKDRANNAPFQGTDTQRWTPAFWQGLATKVEAANQAGFLVVFVGLIEQSATYCATNQTVAQRYPPLVDAKAFTRNVVGLLHGNAVVFSPGFDTDPTIKDGVDLKQRIIDVGTEARRATTRNLLTNHYGTIPVARITALQTQTWLDFHLFQSGAGWGNGTAANGLDRLTERARQMALNLYAATPTKPAINGEAPYDGGTDPFGGANNTRFRARQTGYLSSLSGAFFYTYGSEGVWDWGAFGTPYSTGIARASSDDMTRLKVLIDNVDASTLLAEPARILNQTTVNATKMVLATTWRKDLWAYLPDNANIDIDLTGLGLSPAKWYDPTTGAWQTATATALGGNNYRFTRPATTHADGARDWLLLVDNPLK